MFKIHITITLFYSWNVTYELFTLAMENFVSLQYTQSIQALDQLDYRNFANASNIFISLISFESSNTRNRDQFSARTLCRISY